MTLDARHCLVTLVMLLAISALGLAQSAELVPAAPPSTRSPETAHVPAVIVQLEDEINDYTRDDLIRRFKEARDLGAKAIVLEINSYGGSALAGLETSRFIKQQKDIKVMAFVKEKAISAGALIAVACDGIWMAQHSFIGDSGVIAMSSQGLQELGATERAKAESPVVEDFRDSAARNGYNSLLLESMVVVGREVYFIQDKDGHKQFVDGEKYQQLSKEGWTPVIPDRNPIDSKESLLTLNATVAEQVGLAKGIANSPEDTAEKLGWTVIGRLDRTFGDRLIALLSSSGVRGLLITILIICIYLAVQSPGLGLPESHPTAHTAEAT
jgi:membrane-bound serine protease (ClpP class)